MITIAECKIQCNLLEEEVDFDPWFDQTIPAVVLFVSNAIKRKLYATQQELDAVLPVEPSVVDAENPTTEETALLVAYEIELAAALSSTMVITPDLKLAMLMCIGHWFNNRETTSALSLNEVPMSFQALVGPYRSFKR